MEINLIQLEKCRTCGDGMEEDELLAKAEQQQMEIKCSNETNIIKKTNTTDREILPTQQIPVEYGKKRSTPLTRPQLEKNDNSPLPGLHSLYRRPECVTRSLAPVIPKGELIKLKPRLVTPLNSVPEHKKIKPPKFIPYEPYPGAVNPIEPRQKSGSATPKIIKPYNKNNLDITVLVSQMSTMRTQEMEEVKDKRKAEAALNDQSEVENLKAQLQRMKEERDHFQAQFKFQTQVNAELKNLLVASVGEDLLTRVNVLTEDKLQLARALLDTANNLSTHTEQIEFLAGQCEVWRSKFLASSVMVEELARWKADLTQKNHMLNESTKKLLHTTQQIRDMQLEILKNLKFLAKMRYLNLPAADVLTLSAENLNILQQMVLHTGVGIPEDLNLNISTASSSPLGDAEKYAIQALEFVSQPLIATDEAIRALFCQTQRPYTTPSSCAADQTENIQTT